MPGQARLRDQDGAGLRVLHLVRVLGVGQERELPRAGVLHARARR